MNNLPTELIKAVIDSGDVLKMKNLCDTNSRNKKICENILMNKIWAVTKSVFQLYHKCSPFKIWVNVIEKLQIGGLNTNIIKSRLLYEGYDKMAFFDILKKKLEIVTNEGNVLSTSNRRSAYTLEFLQNAPADWDVFHSYTIEKDKDNFILTIIGGNLNTAEFILNTPENVSTIKMFLNQYPRVFQENGHLRW